MMSAIMLSVAFQLLRYRQMDIETESDILVEMCRDGESNKWGKGEKKKKFLWNLQIKCFGYKKIIPTQIN